MVLGIRLPLTQARRRGRLGVPGLGFLLTYNDEPIAGRRREWRRKSTTWNGRAIRCQDRSWLTLLPASRNYRRPDRRHGLQRSTIRPTPMVSSPARPSRCDGWLLSRNGTDIAPRARQ